MSISPLVAIAGLVLPQVIVIAWLNRRCWGAARCLKMS
jgi:hypothetical protein